MSELGRLLAEARTAKDLSLADVESGTRVRQKYIEALEQGNYAALPQGATARGFIRNYARFLGLDPQRVLGLYAQESGDNGSSLLTAPAGPLRTVDYRPLEVALLREREDNGWWRWLAALALVAALAVAAWWLYINNDWVRTNIKTPNFLAALGPQPTSTMTPTATRPRSVTVTPPAAPAAAEITPTGPVLPAPVLATPVSADQPTPTSDLLTLPIPTTRPTTTPTMTPQATPTPEPMVGISLTLKTTQRSWTKVTADGQVVLQELLEAGQDRGWPANERITVLTGNAAGVLITINSHELGPMGSVGQVVERSWSLDKDGNISESPGGGAAPTATPNR